MTKNSLEKSEEITNDIVGRLMDYAGSDVQELLYLAEMIPVKIVSGLTTSIASDYGEKPALEAFELFKSTVNAIRTMGYSAVEECVKGLDDGTIISTFEQLKERFPSEGDYIDQKLSDLLKKK